MTETSFLPTQLRAATAIQTAEDCAAPVPSHGISTCPKHYSTANVGMNEYSSFKAPLSSSGSSNAIDGYHSFMQFHDLAGTSTSEFYSPPLQVKRRMYKCVRMKCLSFFLYFFC